MNKPINATAIPAQCLGETGALNFKQPTEQDLKDSAALEKALAQMNIFETQEEILQRREALIRLQEISNKWIYTKALEQNLPEHIASATTGKIFTFGSYRLGVNFRGADIDALFVVPRFVTRDEFFSEFQSVLANEESVEDLHAVCDAFVPVLKLKFMGVEIDLLFAQIDAMTVRPDFSLSENSEQLLRNMDERDVRSVNGVRVTEDILNLVYQKDVFKTALKVIRLWAKRKHIYSNALGFLGGVSWGILTSRICQLYPCAAPATIVCHFFTIFSQWPWPKPVRLRDSEYISGLNLPVWDPRHNPPDQYHLMPILTPSYPSQNSTYNVQRSNRIIIEREIKNGLNLVKDILLRKRSWSELFEPTFFFTYRHYFVVIVAGEEKKEFMERCGLVESRLRVLVCNAETNRYVKIAHINCTSYGKAPSDTSELAKKWFIGMEFDRNAGNSSTSLTHTPAAAATAETGSQPAPKLNIDLSDVISSFEKAIDRGGTQDESTTTVTIKYAKKSQLSQFLSPEDMDEIKQQSIIHMAAHGAATHNNLTRHGSNLSTLSTTNSPPNCDSPASVASPIINTIKDSSASSPNLTQQHSKDMEVAPTEACASPSTTAIHLQDVAISLDSDEKDSSKTSPQPGDKHKLDTLQIPTPENYLTFVNGGMNKTSHSQSPPPTDTISTDGDVNSTISPATIAKRRCPSPEKSNGATVMDQAAVVHAAS